MDRLWNETIKELDFPEVREALESLNEESAVQVVNVIGVTTDLGDTFLWGFGALEDGQLNLFMFSF